MIEIKGAAAPFFVIARSLFQLAKTISHELGLPHMESAIVLKGQAVLANALKSCIVIAVGAGMAAFSASAVDDSLLMDAPLNEDRPVVFNEFDSFLTDEVDAEPMVGEDDAECNRAQNVERIQDRLAELEQKQVLVIRSMEKDASAVRAVEIEIEYAQQEMRQAAERLKQEEMVVTDAAMSMAIQEALAVLKEWQKH